MAMIAISGPNTTPIRTVETTINMAEEPNSSYGLVGEGMLAYPKVKALSRKTESEVGKLTAATQFFSRAGNIGRTPMTPIRSQKNNQ